MSDKGAPSQHHLLADRGQFNGDANDSMFISNDQGVGEIRNAT